MNEHEFDTLPGFVASLGSFGEASLSFFWSGPAIQKEGCVTGICVIALSRHSHLWTCGSVCARGSSFFLILCGGG